MNYSPEATKTYKGTCRIFSKLKSARYPNHDKSQQNFNSKSFHNITYLNVNPLSHLSADIHFLHSLRTPNYSYLNTPNIITPLFTTICRQNVTPFFFPHTILHPNFSPDFEPKISLLFTPTFTHLVANYTAYSFCYE